MPIPAAADPADQRRQPDPKITGDLALRAPAGLRQADRFLLKSLRKPSLWVIEFLIAHRELSTFPKQVHGENGRTASRFRSLTASSRTNRYVVIKQHKGLFGPIWLGQHRGNLLFARRATGIPEFLSQPIHDLRNMVGLRRHGNKSE